METNIIIILTFFPLHFVKDPIQVLYFHGLFLDFLPKSVEFILRVSCFIPEGTTTLAGPHWPHK